MRRFAYKKNKKSRREKIGFFTAFSICLVAIGLALWSTYESIGGFDSPAEPIPSQSSVAEVQTEPVGQAVTGVTVFETVAETTRRQTEPAVTEPRTAATQASLPDPDDALQTILQVPSSLEYPVKSKKVIAEYSEKAVFNKTMGDYRAHMGTDFSANNGENVLAMADGVVDDIYSDGLLGNIIKITNGNFSVLYCGVSETTYCAEGDSVKAGEIIAKVDTVPCEAADPMHIHIEVRVGGNPIDPLTVISNDE